MKQKLTQYVDLKKEIDELHTRKVKTESDIARIKEECEVIDTVTGGLGGTQHFKIEGFPTPLYERKEELLFKLVIKLDQAERKRLNALCEIEDFIENIEDSHIRRIISLRFIDGLSWSEVASHMGSGYTEDSVRMSMNRYLKM